MQKIKIDKLLTEKDFEGWLKELARTFGYQYYHTWRSIHSPAGFPDSWMIRIEPEPRLIIAELKTEKGQPTVEQYAWLSALQTLAEMSKGLIQCYLWRPSDRDEIERILI